MFARLEGVEWDRWSAPLASAGRIALIAVAAWVTIVVLQKLVRALRVRLVARIGDTDTALRAATLGRVVRYVIAVVIGAVAVMLVLAEVGISLAPILGAAGVVGLAVGFGAQSLVKDYFTGFFLLFEDQIRTGDVVQIAGIGGLVEDVTLRHVRLRDFVPNGLITTVTNMGRGHAYAVVDVGVDAREDAEMARAVMTTVAAALRDDPTFAPRILEELEMAGIERWEGGAIVLRCRFKVAPLGQWDVRREYLRRLKKAFEERGIEMPYQRLALHAGVDRDSGEAALPLYIRRRPGSSA